MAGTGVLEPARPQREGFALWLYLRWPEGSRTRRQPAPPPALHPQRLPPGRTSCASGPSAQPALALQSFPWRLARGNGLALPHKERQYTIASALPKPCFFEDFYGPYAKANEKGPYFLTEYSTHQLFSQLTLLQQVLGAAGRPRGRGDGAPRGGG